MVPRGKMGATKEGTVTSITQGCVLTLLQKLECFDDKCQFYHVKGTKRRRDKKQITNTHFPTMLNSNGNENPNFLDIVRILKTEMSAMDKKLSSVLTQFDQFQKTLIHPSSIMTPLQQKNPQSVP